MTATEHAPDTEAHEHVSDWIYIKIAIVLAVLTVIEVFTYFESVHQMSETLLVITLSVLMVVKFVLVAAYFMHLKYDNAIFTKFIAMGLIIAWPVYGVFAFSQEWLSDWNWIAKVLLLVVPSVITAVWLLWAWQGPDDDAAH